LETITGFKTKIYDVNGQSFTDIALSLFRFQAVNNPIYKSFIEYLSVNPVKIDTLEAIPYLPISFFKSHAIKTGTWKEETRFSSSGTTGRSQSIHSLPDLDFYLNHSRYCFEYFFGSLTNFHFLALLPSYLERKGSSLIAMIEFFIRESQSEHSSFYLYNVDRLLDNISKLTDKRKIILWGVSFAFLDMAERYNVDLSHCLIFETGGMKGRRKEITRQELHDIIRHSFHSENIFSEYGMTELLSQAYTRSGARFHCSPWMKVIGREITDPMKKGLIGDTSALNVIDLANWHSIAFIETEDIGKVYADGSFEVLGRIDNSDVRGCNLLVE
jgi:hypothetical protein